MNIPFLRPLEGFFVVSGSYLCHGCMEEMVRCWSAKKFVDALAHWFVGSLRTKRSRSEAKRSWKHECKQARNETDEWMDG